MLGFLKKFMASYDSYMTLVGREKAREVLLNSSDRMLEDAGFSRELLEVGVKAWPWRVTSDESLPPMQLSHIGDQQVVGELESYSDRELSDLGVSRGSIQEAVLFGREGIERDPERKVA
ncbi:MAG: hypothetical protein AB8B79_19940 [Granulosicoccus sp.]